MVLSSLSSLFGKSFAAGWDSHGSGYLFSNGCTISLVSTGPQLVRPAAPAERNWIPLAIAAAVVVAVTVVLVLVLGHGKNAPQVTPISAQLDAYAPSLSITHLAMSESANLAGGKVTYLDGHIANLGDRTVTEAVVEVTFRDYANKVAQSQKMPLTLVRMREPYIDTVSLSVAPLKPGAQQDFRLIFDAVSPDWAGALPEMRILHISVR